MSSYPTPSPSPGPTPVPVPTPTPSVQNVVLPDIPTNAYQLLLNAADAIDTTHSGFSTSLGRLGDITTETTTATHEVISTSQGTATDALATLWGNTKIDLNGAHDPLTSVITPSSLGGSPNGLRAVLDQHKVDFQDGILAMEQIQMLQRSCPVQPPSPQQVEEWIQQVHNLTNALGNVSMAMQAIIMAIRSINGGFAAVCATGLVPGQPLPTFNKNAFAMTSSGGSGSGKISAQDLDTYIEEQGGSEEASNFVSLLAEENNISLDNIKTLIDSGATSDQVYQWLVSGKLTDSNLSDITALLDKGVGSDTVATLLDNEANLKETATNVTFLLERGDGDANQIATWLQGLDADQLAYLKNRASQSPKMSIDNLEHLVDPTLEYKLNEKHSVQRPGVGPQPSNAQSALNNSVTYKPTTLSRVAIDPKSQEIVVIDDTNNGTFHGHVETYQQLDQDQQNALKINGFIDGRGRIILRDKLGNIIGYGKNVTKRK